MSQPHQKPDTHLCCFIAQCSWEQSQATTALISAADGQQKSAFAGECKGSNGFGMHQGYQRSSSVGHRHKCNNQCDKKPCKKAQGVSSVEKKKKKKMKKRLTKKERLDEVAGTARGNLKSVYIRAGCS